MCLACAVARRVRSRSLESRPRAAARLERRIAELLPIALGAEARERGVDVEPHRPAWLVAWVDTAALGADERRSFRHPQPGVWVESSGRMATFRTPRRALHRQVSAPWPASRVLGRASPR